MTKFLGMMAMLAGILLLMIGAHLGLYRPMVASDPDMSNLIDVTGSIVLMTIGGCTFSFGLVTTLDD